MDDCVFCNIVNKTLAKDILYEDGSVVVFNDILPKAPVHFLVITREHIPSVNHLDAGRQELVGHMIYTAKQMAEKLGIGESGYKLTFNVGHDGGQVVPHLHLHVLGGKKMPE